MLRVTMLFWSCLEISLALDANIPKYAPYVPGHGQRPDCAKHNRTYCDVQNDVDKYPKDVIIKLLDKRGDELRESTSYMFDENFDRYFNKGDEYGASDISLRNNLSTTNSWEEDGCRKWTTVTRPYVAMNEKRKWRYIVNIPTHMNQSVQVEYCEATHCNPEIRIRNRRLEAKCFQIFMSRNLMALHPTGNKLIRDNFLMPSCCQCNLAKKLVYVNEP